LNAFSRRAEQLKKQLQNVGDLLVDGTLWDTQQKILVEIILDILLFHGVIKSAIFSTGGVPASFAFGHGIFPRPEGGAAFVELWTQKLHHRSSVPSKGQRCKIKF